MSRARNGDVIARSSEVVANISLAMENARDVDPRLIDQCVFLWNVSWEHYEALVAMRGESSRPRIAYLKGAVELMSPGTAHETDKKRLARLIEAWSEEAEIDLDGVGSWTLENEELERAVEPDECYIVCDRHKTTPKVPDFAIEVIYTSGCIDKLEIYRALGVREVWLWEDDALAFHVLRGSRYVKAQRSTLVPTLDPKLIARFVRFEGRQVEAVRALRRAMRRKR